jgi:hypothetical protein
MQIYRRNLLRWPGATLLFVLFAFVTVAAAQAPPEDSSALRQIIERLDRLERQNRELTEEVHALRQELAAKTAPDGAETAKTAPADVAERVDVQERRIEEQDQTKVGSSQHLPIRITGMALFNASLNSTPTGGLETPVVAPVSGNALTGGATVRQTILGLDFQGPEILGGGKVSGFINMDFFGGTGTPYNSVFRIRTAALEINWANTSITVGQDKPLIAPREPNSLAEVGIPPLSGAGNLWLWQPQMRVEQRFHLDEHTILRAQGALLETRENYGYVPQEYAPSLENARPAVEGRFSLAHNLDDDRRIEIGSGFDASTSHVAGTTVPSRVFALDWFANPWRKLEFSGAFFQGQNLSNIGGVGQGFTIMEEQYVVPVHADGGWAQLSFLVTPRLTFNLFGGEQDNRQRDLVYGGVARNLAYAANLMYRLAPNVIVSFESGQLRTDYLSTGTRLNNHYDLGLAYLF